MSTDQESTFFMSPPAQPQPGAAALPPQKRRRITPLRVAIIGMVLCLALAICAVLAGRLVLDSIRDRIKIEARIDAFMEAMADRDAARANTALSSHARQEMSQADLETMTHGASYAQFEGYRRIKVSDTRFHDTSSRDPGEPHGRHVIVTGTIDYDGGFRGNFSASLEKEGEHWFLYRIEITVPPGKVVP